MDNIRTDQIVDKPLIIMMVSGLLLWAAGLYAYYYELISTSIVVFCHMLLVGYPFFSITHDAAHGCIAKNKFINGLVGQVACKFLFFGSPHTYTTFSITHQWHHKYSGDPDKDPDHWCGRGLKWLLPLRWCVVDFYQVYFCFKHFDELNPSAKRQIVLEVFIDALVILAIAQQGFLMAALLCGVIPCRLGLFNLYLWAVYLPHYSYNSTDIKNPYKTTWIMLGCERILTPLFMLQNYHLAHHLYPSIPIYKHAKIWKAQEAYHLSKNPVLVSPSGKRINPKNKLIASVGYG